MAGQARITTALLARWAGGFVDVPLLIVNTRTHRIAYTGPNGEPGFGDDPGGGAISWVMDDGRTAWYFVGATPDPGNVDGLARYRAAQAFGRIEGFVSLGSIQDTTQAAIIGYALLADRCVPMESITAGIEPSGSGDSPYVDFSPSDWLWVPEEAAVPLVASGSDGAALPQATIHVDSTHGITGPGALAIEGSLVMFTGTTGTAFTGCSGGTGTMHLGDAVYLLQQARVEALGVQENDEGFVSYTAELGSLAQEAEALFQGWLATMTAGTLGGTVQAASPASVSPIPARQPNVEIVTFQQPSGPAASPNPLISDRSDEKKFSTSGTFFKTTANLTNPSTSGNVVVTIYMNGIAIGTITILVSEKDGTPIYFNQPQQGALTASPDRFSVAVTSLGTNASGLVVELFSAGA